MLDAVHWLEVIKLHNFQLVTSIADNLIFYLNKNLHWFQRLYLVNISSKLIISATMQVIVSQTVSDQ